jgi:4-hydroxy-tetrahydrodipicolinate synthase
MTELAGVFPVVPTPFTDDGAIDEAAFLRLVDFVIESGADGCVYPGMASEVETLTPAERARMVTLLGERLGRRIAFIVGASDADPASAAARAEEGRAAGAVAAMVMAPHARGADIPAQVDFFTVMGGNTALPIMLQNAPAPMGAGLPPATVAAVARAVPRIRFIKEETQPCGQNVSAIRAASGDALDAVFGGAGARYVMDELARGAAGTMPALEFADVHARLMAAWRAGDSGAARALYSRMLPFLLFQATFRVRATKRMLRARGLLPGVHARAGGVRLDAMDEVECAALIAEAADLFTIHRVNA